MRTLAIGLLSLLVLAGCGGTDGGIEDLLFGDGGDQLAPAPPSPAPPPPAPMPMWSMPACEEGPPLFLTFSTDGGETFAPTYIDPLTDPESLTGQVTVGLVATDVLDRLYAVVDGRARVTQDAGCSWRHRLWIR